MARAVALLALAAMLGGCSVKFAYNNVDRLIRWQVNDYVELNGAQRDYLVREVDIALFWHRKNHLPQYADFLDGIPAQFSDGVTPGMIEAIFDRLFAWADEMQEQALPVASEIMVSLSDDQLVPLPERLAESNEELAEPEVDGTLEEHQARWAEEMRDMLSNFVGRLNREQKTYVELRAKGYQPELVLWAEYRARWQAALLELLAERKAPHFTQAFRELVKERESYYGEEFAAVSAANEQLAREIAAHILSNLSERQRERFAERLAELSEDLRALAAQG